MPSALQMTGSRLASSAASSSSALQMTGSVLSSPGATSSALQMFGSVLSAPSPDPWPGRYRYDSTRGEFKRYVRHRYNAATGTWVAMEYGQPAPPYTAAESWAVSDRQLWPLQWQQSGNGSAAVVSGRGVLTPGPGAYANGWQVAYLSAMQPLVDYVLSGTVGFAGGNIEQYVVAGMAKSSARKSGDTGPTDGVYLQWFPLSGAFGVYRTNVSTPVSLSDNVAYSYIPGVAINFQLAKVGAVVSAWLWNVGSAQPSNPTWTGTDPAPYMGKGRPYLAATNGATSAARSASFGSLNVTPYSLATLPSGGNVVGSAVRSALVAATASGTVTANTTMPVGNLPGWVQSYTEDFVTPVAEGGFVFDTNNALASTSAAYPAYFNSMNGNHDGVKDNSGFGEYRPSATFSVANSVLTCRQRVIAGVPVGGHYHPIRPGQSPINGNYFSGPNPYSWLKFRARTSGSGYGFGFVGFYLSNPWPQGGEYDWPEGSVYETAIKGNHHEAYAGAKPYPVDTIGPAPLSLIKQDWHIYEIKWFPGHVQYIVDGIVVNDFTVGVGTQQMAVYFQGVTDQPASTFTANPGVTGSWELDWVVIYDYTP